MNKIQKIFLILTLSSTSTYAVVSHTPTQLLDMACPTEWKNIDVVIDPASVSWSSAADKNAFLEYQDRYEMHTTKSWSSVDNQYVNDPLTVASECALRKNIVVDNYYNKPIDVATILKARIHITPIIMSLLLD